MPFSEDHNVDHPLSIYAASKKAKTWSYLQSPYRIPTTGLRFFTVYGPWGRPDMALFIFCKSILDNKPIDIFNHGLMARVSLAIADIVEGVVKVFGKPAAPDEALLVLTLQQPQVRLPIEFLILVVLPPILYWII